MHRAVAIATSPVPKAGAHRAAADWPAVRAKNGREKTLRREVRPARPTRFGGSRARRKADTRPGRTRPTPTRSPPTKKAIHAVDPAARIIMDYDGGSLPISPAPWAIRCLRGRPLLCALDHEHMERDGSAVRARASPPRRFGTRWVARRKSRRRGPGRAVGT